MSVGTIIDRGLYGPQFVSVPYVRDVRWDEGGGEMVKYFIVSVPYVRDVRWDLAIGGKFSPTWFQSLT